MRGQREKRPVDNVRPCLRGIQRAGCFDIFQLQGGISMRPKSKQSVGALRVLQ